MKAAGAASDERGGRYYEPVEIPGEILGPLVNKKIENLAVYSWQGGKWRPALFQIDERTPDGAFILTHGPEADPDRANGVFDPQDLIVFMARDAGEEAKMGDAPAGADSAVPVELMDPLTGVRSWAYVARFRNGATKSDLDPVSVLIDEGDVFNLRFPTYGYDALINRREKEAIPTIFINRLWVLPEAGGSGENIIDRQKIRGSITFLGGAIKVPINEKIVSGGVVAYKPGPVRILTHSCMYPLFPMGIKGPRFYIDTILVDTLTLTTTTVAVPFDPGVLIHDMTLSFGTDLTPAAEGMRYYNSVNLEGFLVDGVMDERENKFAGAKDQWRLVTGPQGAQIQYTKFDPKFLANGESFSTYNDNEGEAHPPENYAGDLGAASDMIVIRSLKAGAYKIETFGCVPYDFYDQKGLDAKLLESILNVPGAPLIIRAGGKEIINKGGTPRTIIDR